MLYTNGYKTMNSKMIMSFITDLFSNPTWTIHNVICVSQTKKKKRLKKIQVYCTQNTNKVIFIVSGKDSRLYHLTSRGK